MDDFAHSPQNGEGRTPPGQAPASLGRAAPGAGRGLSLSLSPAGLAGALLLLAVGFVGVFCLGILIGRGHNPEAGIPELARIMPEPAPRNAPTVIADDGGPGAARTNATDNAERGRHDPAAPGVIDQGDLAYRVHLKTPAASRQPEKRPDAAPGKTADKAQARTKAQPQSRAADQNAAAKAPEAGQGRAAPDQKAAEGDAAKRPQSADTHIYHYSYQTASFADQPSCEAFAARLKKAGFAARAEKVESGGKTWFRAMVDFTGRPDDTDAVRDKLKDHGVPKALLRSKVPAQ